MREKNGDEREMRDKKKRDGKEVNENKGNRKTHQSRIKENENKDTRHSSMTPTLDNEAENKEDENKTRRMNKSSTPMTMNKRQNKQLNAGIHTEQKKSVHCNPNRSDKIRTLQRRVRQEWHLEIHGLVKYSGNVKHIRYIIQYRSDSPVHGWLCLFVCWTVNMFLFLAFSFVCVCGVVCV